MSCSAVVSQEFHKLLTLNMSPLPTSESSIPEKNQGLTFPQAPYNHEHATPPPICEGSSPSFSVPGIFLRKQKIFGVSSIFSQIYNIAQENVEVWLKASCVSFSVTQQTRVHLGPDQAQRGNKVQCAVLKALI